MNIDEKLDLIIQEMSAMNSRLSSLEDKVSNMDDRLSSVERKATETNLILENVVKRSVNAVAEGHLDIIRKLNDVLVLSLKQEQLDVRVACLELDMKKVKENQFDSAQNSYAA